jgi:hypothetical protein
MGMMLIRRLRRALRRTHFEEEENDELKGFDSAAILDQDRPHPDTNTTKEE